MNDYTVFENPKTSLFLDELNSMNGDEWIKQYFKGINFNTAVNEKTAICFLSIGKYSLSRGLGLYISK